MGECDKRHGLGDEPLVNFGDFSDCWSEVSEGSNAIQIVEWTRQDP